MLKLNFDKHYQCSSDTYYSLPTYHGYITPGNTARLMSILIVILVMLYPTLIFSFGAVILSTFLTMLYACISSTMLLAVASEFGTVAYVCCFGIWAFWNCWLRWGIINGVKRYHFYQHAILWYKVDVDRVYLCI